MNSLSWWLYVTDVVTKLNDTLNFILSTIIICTVLAFFINIILLVAASDNTSRTRTQKKVDEDVEETWEFTKSYWFKLFSHWWLVAIFYILAAIVPGEKTMYLILASEAGENVLESEEMTRIRKIINNKLDEFDLEPIEEESE